MPRKPITSTPSRSLPPPKAEQPAALVVIPDRAQREIFTAALSAHGLDCACAASGAQARLVLAQRPCAVALIQAKLPDEDGLRLASELHAARPVMPVVLVAAETTLELAVQAMHAGAADLISVREGAAALSQRLAAALERARSSAKREQRQHDKVQRLMDLCRRLNAGRHAAMRHSDDLNQNMSRATRELNLQMDQAVLAGEFAAVLRQELDLENLLRVSLESMLARVGTTNAAIFLPSSGGDFSVGAYVNADSTREATQILLDHLADSLPRRVRPDGQPTVMNSRSELVTALGPSASWLEDNSAVMMSCRHEGETLAVLIFYRPRLCPFMPQTVSTIATMAGVFGRQLAKVVRLHHRHTPGQGHGFGGGDTKPQDDRGDRGDDLDMAA